MKRKLILISVHYLQIEEPSFVCIVCQKGTCSKQIFIVFVDETFITQVFRVCVNCLCFVRRWCVPAWYIEFRESFYYVSLECLVRKFLLSCFVISCSDLAQYIEICRSMFWHLFFCIISINCLRFLFCFF